MIRDLFQVVKEILVTAVTFSDMISSPAKRKTDNDHKFTTGTVNLNFDIPTIYDHVQSKERKLSAR